MTNFGSNNYMQQAMPADTGAISLFTNSANLFTLTPTGNCTINSAESASKGSDMFIIITSSGTVARTITFGTNFKTTGTLSTGTVSGKVFALHFIGKDGVWVQVARTAAM